MSHSVGTTVHSTVVGHGASTDFIQLAVWPLEQRRRQVGPDLPRGTAQRAADRKIRPPLGRSGTGGRRVV